MILVPPPCSYCHETAHMVPRIRHYRRGARMIEVNSGLWQCDHCSDPFTGQRPFQFTNADLMEWADAKAASTWLTTYGEPMPQSEQGRRPSQGRTVRVPVLFTASEVARMDAARGKLTRSEYLRQRL